eukprot:1158608-Prymnesium_polylepis.2
MFKAVIMVYRRGGRGQRVFTCGLRLAVASLHGTCSRVASSIVRDHTSREADGNTTAITNQLSGSRIRLLTVSLPLRGLYERILYGFTAYPLPPYTGALHST